MPRRVYATDEERQAAQIVQHRAAAQRARDRVRAERVAQGLRVYRRKSDQERAAARARRRECRQTDVSEAFSVAAAHRRLDAIAACDAALAQAEREANSENTNPGHGPSRYGSSKIRANVGMTTRSARDFESLPIGERPPSMDPTRVLWAIGAIPDEPLLAGCLIAHGKHQARKDGGYGFTLEAIHSARWAAERANTVATEEEVADVD